MIRPPDPVGWTRLWHEIVHIWNRKIRVLSWCPLGRLGPGNPRHHWLTKIIDLSRYKQLGTGKV